MMMEKSEIEGVLEAAQLVPSANHGMGDAKIENIVTRHSTHLFVISAQGSFVLSASVPDGRRPPFAY